MDGENWPEDIIIRRFFEKRKDDQSTSRNLGRRGNTANRNAQSMDKSILQRKRALDRSINPNQNNDDEY